MPSEDTPQPGKFGWEDPEELEEVETPENTPIPEGGDGGGYR